MKGEVPPYPGPILHMLAVLNCGGHMHLRRVWGAPFWEFLEAMEVAGIASSFFLTWKNFPVRAFTVAPGPPTIFVKHFFIYFLFFIIIYYNIFFYNFQIGAGRDPSPINDLRCVKK